jgi:hypothetical protein
MTVASAVYPGRPFRRDESLYFFGRQEHVDELLGRLEETTFLAVVGLSGSGKSSLVFAGLIPALERGHLPGAGATWKIAEMRPGSDPLGGLLRCLDRALGAVPERAAQLRSGPLGLIEASRTGRGQSENLLLVVDQFEELFRFQRDHRNKAHEAAEFVRLLIAATQEYGARLYVVITMRSDYLGDCSRFPGLPEILNGSQYLTPRLTRDQAREAVRGPAALPGVEIDPSLLESLLDQTTERRDQLPILQHVLMRMWTTPGRGSTLTTKEFLAVGGLNALNVHVQEVYDAAPDKELARRVFQCLTDSSEGDRENRRPRRLAELAAETGASESAVTAVVEHFRAEGRSFLTSPDDVLTSDSVIDIQHESIIREWASLRQWAQQEADSGKWYQRVEDRARVGRGRVYLMDDELTAALNARERGRWNEAWSRRYAGDDGLEFADVTGLLEASRQQHLEAKRKARRRWWGLIATTVAFAVLAITVVVLLRTARAERDRAERQSVALTQTLADLENQRLALTKTLGDLEKSRTRADSLQRALGELTGQPIPKLTEAAAADQGYPPCAPFNAGAAEARTSGPGIGVSLHFATNRLNPKAYNGWDGKLASPLEDAKAMQRLAASLGYTTNFYLDNQARSDCLATALIVAASTLRSGDVLLLTTSGHGAQTPFLSDTEPDKKLETWVLFDNQVTASDLYDIFTRFKSGVTVIVVEDIAHAPVFRRPKGSSALAATLLVLAGAREDQVALDGQTHGAFTESFLAVWDSGKFRGTYTDFIAAVQKRMPSAQQPQLYVYPPGAAAAALPPFRLPRSATNAASAGTTSPK